MDAHEPLCDQKHTPRQRCNEALRDAAPATAGTPEPELASAAAEPEPEVIAENAMPDEVTPAPTAAEPDASREVPEPAGIPVAAGHPAGETNGASLGAPLAETLRTTTAAGAEWQKSLAALETGDDDSPEPDASATGRRVPTKAIVAAVSVASIVALAAILRRRGARRVASD